MVTRPKSRSKHTPKPEKRLKLVEDEERPHPLSCPHTEERKLSCPRATGEETQQEASHLPRGEARTGVDCQTTSPLPTRLLTQQGGSGRKGAPGRGESTREGLVTGQLPLTEAAARGREEGDPFTDGRLSEGPAVLVLQCLRGEHSHVAGSLSGEAWRCPGRLQGPGATLPP